MSPRIPSPIGRLVNIGNQRLHIYSTGEGSPSVIFESGGASWCLDWFFVQTEVAKFTKACSYDRAGFGWSDSGIKPRTSEQIVAELHSLLSKAEINQPYIMVGASFGGHTARLYAKRFPKEVAGIILVDARHEDIDVKMPPAWKKMQTSGRGMYQFMLLASRIGLLKLLGKSQGGKAMPPIVSKLPPELRSIYLTVGFQPKYFLSNLDELAAIVDSDKQLHLDRSLGDIPITVIRHGIPNLFSSMPVEQAKQAEYVWQELQEDLAKLSSNSQLIIAEKSGHGIQIDQPDLLVDVIKQMVLKAYK